MPNQNQGANPDVTTPETGKAPERRKLLRNIVAVGAAAAVGMLAANSLPGEGIGSVHAGNGCNLVLGCFKNLACHTTRILGCIASGQCSGLFVASAGEFSHRGAANTGVLYYKCNTSSAVQGLNFATVPPCCPSVSNGCTYSGNCEPNGVWGLTHGAGSGVIGKTTNKCGVGVSGLGCAGAGAGAFRQNGTSHGIPVLQTSSTNNNYLLAKFYNYGSACHDTSAVVQLEACSVSAPKDWNVAVGGAHNGFGLTSGQFYLENPIGTVRLLIDSSGRVGIGTTSPQNSLDVVGAAAVGTYAGANTAPSNGLIVSGSVGIGTATPEAPLTVVSGTSITAALIGSSQGNLIFAKSGTNGFSMYSNAANYLGFYSNDSGLQPLTMNGSGVAVGNAYRSTAPPTNGAIIEGSVGIGTSAPTQTLSVQGTAGKSCGGSTWATFSDRRWKCQDSIQPYTEGLAWVRSLPPPMRFRYAKGNGIGADPKKEHVNFVAQCLLDGTHQNLVSEIRAKVKTSDKEPTTTYAVNVSDMQFAMLNAIKELAEENTTLREQLTTENKAIREEIRTLQDTVKRLAAS